MSFGGMEFDPLGEWLRKVEWAGFASGREVRRRELAAFPPVVALGEDNP